MAIVTEQSIVNGRPRTALEQDKVARYLRWPVQQLLRCSSRNHASNYWEGLLACQLEILKHVCMDELVGLD